MSAVDNFVPTASLPLLSKYFTDWEVNLVVTRKRITKHGDFRALPKGMHQITVNEMPNPYRFLITTVHEIAHLVTYKDFGPRSNPRKGVETRFQRNYITFSCVGNFSRRVVEGFTAALSESKGLF